MKALALYREAAELLADAGYDGGRETLPLLLAAAGISRERLFRENPELDPARIDRFREWVRRRAGHEPMAYILGRAEFLGLDLRVDRRVLIPRPETEWMTAEIIAHLRKRRYEPGSIADVGVGSGCIALSLAKAFPDARVFGSDISGPALELASENARRCGLQDRVEFARGPGLDPAPAGLAFDLVVANPPYVSERERADLAPDVRDYEPPTALYAGPDGLSVYRDLIPRLPQRLSAKARIFFEIGRGQSREVSRMFRAEGFETTCWRDLAGIDRVIYARRR